MEKKRYFDWEIKKCNFLRVFLKTRYLNKNLEFPPFFPTRYDRSDSNFFYKYFNRIGVQIFFLKMLFVRNLASVKKLVPLKKTRFLIVSSALSFSQSRGIRNNIFQTNNTHPRFLPSCQKKISALKSEEWVFAGREGLRSFLVLVTAISPWRKRLESLSLAQLLLQTSRSICPK